MRNPGKREIRVIGSVDLEEIGVPTFIALNRNVNRQFFPKPSFHAWKCYERFYRRLNMSNPGKREIRVIGSVDLEEIGVPTFIALNRNVYRQPFRRAVFSPSKMLRTIL